ncbi:TIGR03668 family PPOX class F420-dependent oxidoreductase [Streptomyces olivochromogenes]|uniref:TIGR03668 family PPOX class F420-dependent oxidoreductase n=1 Tax=Streptomyces olivochromogenes TaxID=1963 RepID=UPI001F20BDC1|nr:TIGR03668 family PPOX class F420-dependent oxidoreductase [Streptomyces olivochromogenes]MCF3135095.1 TIGR03668 family PPOX class F420-dependent oxidoreductase [Streptomyces olivochromogenes]
MPEMTEQEARRRFTGARVARLATVDEAGRPHLVPVVFAGQGTDGIVTAVDRKPKTTTRLKRLRNIAARPDVCLLADAYDEDWERLWWVRADGAARVLLPDAADSAERDACAAAVTVLRDKYPQYWDAPPHGPVIAVTVRHWTGWRAQCAAVIDPPGLHPATD